MRFRTALFAVCALCAGRAEAQIQGGFGMGFGSLACKGSLTCRQGNLGEAPMSVSAFGYLGDQVNSRTLSGAEVGLWIASDGIVTTQGTASWVVLVRPWLRAGLRLKGGLGLSLAGFSGLVGDIQYHEYEVGVATTLGLSYEFPAFRRASLSVGLNFVSTAPMENPFNDDRSTWQVTFGVIPH